MRTWGRRVRGDTKYGDTVPWGTSGARDPARGGSGTPPTSRGRVGWVARGSGVPSVPSVRPPPGMVSLWSLAVVAFERFLVICKPLGNFTFRGSHAVLGCAATWIFGLVASVPPLFGWSRSGGSPGFGGRWEGGRGRQLA